MSFSSRREDKGIDWITFSIYLTMLGVGWLMVFTVGYGDGYPDNLAELLLTTIVGKQTIFMGVALLVLFFTQLIDWKFWRTFAWPIFGISLLLLIAVLFFGNTVKGATSWFSLGGFSFQPSELAKFGTCVALAAFLNDFNTSLRNSRHQLIAVGLMMLPIALILLQPDAGSALVFLSFFFVLYRGGFPVNFFLVASYLVVMLLLGLVFKPSMIMSALFLVGTGISLYNLKMNGPGRLALMVLLVGVAWWAANYRDWMFWVLAGSFLCFLSFSIVLWLKKKDKLVYLLYAGMIVASAITFTANYSFNNFLRSHQRDRINVWLRPDLCDPRGSLYNVVQSKMAIGSGGFQGKGFLEGNMTKLNYVPEQSTDFIFCTIGEEQGFIGTFSIVGLFLLLLYRITVLAERQRSDFSKYYAYGVAGIIFTHVFINIGMTIGLMPVVGIPLPFISYGGSSLLGFTLLIGVLLQLDAHRGEP